MPAFFLSIETSALYSLDSPTLEILIGGIVVASGQVLGHSGIGNSILNFSLDYTGNYPSTLSFRFNDGSVEGGRNITLHNVQVNGWTIDTTYISMMTLTNGQSAAVNTAATDHLYGRVEPVLADLGTITIADTPGMNNATLRGTTGRDVISADDGDDTVDGGDDDDAISGGGGTNIINGGNGNDLILGGSGKDTISGGNGNDQIYGAGGHDVLVGGAGNDMLNGGDGNDMLSGGIGNDIMYGGNGNDILAGDAGNDIMYGDDGADQMLGGAGNDTMHGGNGNDQMAGGAGADIMNGDDGDDDLDGGADNDTINGGAGSDRIMGGTGNDTLNGGNDNDYILGDTGDDTLNGDDGDDSLMGGSGSDILNGGNGNDTLFGHTVDSTTATAIVQADPNVFFNLATGSFYKYIAGPVNFATAQAHAAAATLNGVAGHLVTITSQAENAYVAALAAGNTVWLGASDAAVEGTWRWLYGNETGMQFWAGTSGGNAVNNFYNMWNAGEPNNTGDSDGAVMLPGGVWADQTVATANGYIIEWEGELFGDDSSTDTLTGGAGNDTLYGGGGADILYGGTGTDFMFGGSGIDTVTYETASSGVNVSLLTGAATNDGDGGTDTLGGLENIIGSAFNDILAGENNTNFILGGAGNDTIFGYGGADTLYGEGDNDTIFGGQGADTIYGGNGADILYAGDTGASLPPLTFPNVASLTVYDGSQDGAGTVSLFNGNAGLTLDGNLWKRFASSQTITATTVIEFDFMSTDEPDITTIGFENDTNFSNDSNRFYLNGTQASGINVAGGFTNFLYGMGSGWVHYRIDIGTYFTGTFSHITFINDDDAGPLGNAHFNNIVIYDAANVDTANNTLYGDAGDDILYGAGGHDTLNGGSGTDTASYGNAISGVTVSLITNIASNDGNGSTDTLVSIENLTGSNFDDNLTGNASVNIITGGYGNDILNGRGGNDTLDGGSGLDTAYYGDATGSVTASLVTGTATDSEGGTDSLISIENLTGGAYADTLTGDTAANVLTGGGGADIISAGDGNDTINLANGDFAAGESLAGDNGTDTLQLTNGTTVDLSIGTLATIEILTGSGSNDIVTLSAVQWVGIPTINLAGGAADVLNVLASGNISASATPTVTNVETGNLAGTAGNDTVTMTGAQLNAIIIGAGIIDLGAGAADTLNLTTTSADLNTLGATDGSILGLEIISAATAAGSVTINLSGQTEAFTVTGGGSADTITTGTGADTINGGGGNDTINIFNGSFVAGESITGGANTDSIVMTNATTVNFATGTINTVETLTGSGGDDIVTMLGTQWAGFTTINLGAGAGDTMYIIANGDITALNNPGGTGVENSSLIGTAGTDTITLSGTQFNNIIIGAGTVDLGAGTGDTINITSTASDLNTLGLTDASIVGVEIISAATAAAGVTITLSGQTEAFTITGSANNDNITGGTGADIIDGGAGNDTINLANGSFVAGESITGGANTDTIALTNATTVNFATGTINTVETLTGSGSNDDVSMSGTQWGGFTTINLGAGAADILSIIANGDISALTIPGTLSGIEIGNLFGTGGNDTITLTGAQLNAIIIGTGIINMGAGTGDTINLTSTSSDLNTLGLVNASIQGVEAISAATAAAGVTITLSGQTEAFTVTGSNNADTITGGSGGDILLGGGGNDTLTSNSVDTLSTTILSILLASPEAVDMGFGVIKHTFSAIGSSTFKAHASVDEVFYLLVGGGGGGGGRHGGGGGGGGVLTNWDGQGTAHAITGGTSYTVVVGDGGTYSQTAPSNQSVGTNGANTTFDGLIARGGGGGGSYTAPVPTGGGSGGGGGGVGPTTGGTGDGAGNNRNGGAANQADSADGNGIGNTGGNGAGPGVTSDMTGGGGGGGAGASGNNASGNLGGAGGIGFQSDISGTNTYYAGGGGGGSGGAVANTALGGLGGGGNGGSLGAAGVAGTDGTGGGGGGARSDAPGGSTSARGGDGGSGIAIIRYQLDPTGPVTTLNGGAGADTLYGGNGQDMFVFDAAHWGSIDTVYNYNKSHFDILDIGDLLTGYTAGVSNANNFARFVVSGADLLLQVDQNGTTGGVSFSTTATLIGQAGAGLNIDFMVENNALIMV